MPLQTAAARLHLGLLTEAELPALARTLIQQGHDNPALRGLAGGGIPVGSRLPLLAHGLTQAGAPVLGDAEALGVYVRNVSMDIHSGRVTPYDGARSAAALRARFPTNRVLIDFDGLVNEWNSWPAGRPKVEKEIETLAVLVLAGSA